MNSPQYDQTIRTLKERVGEYNPSIKPPGFAFKMIPNISGLSIKYKSYFIYIFIPMIIAISLAILRPSPLIREEMDEDGNITNKLQLYRLFITTILISIGMGVIIGVYYYKKQKSLSN